MSMSDIANIRTDVDAHLRTVVWSQPELEFLNKKPNPGILESRDLR
jgi:hypothetical protein